MLLKHNYRAYGKIAINLHYIFILTIPWTSSKCIDQSQSFDLCLNNC